MTDSVDLSQLTFSSLGLSSDAVSADLRSTLPGPAQRIIAPDAPPKLRLMAARGVVPGLKPDALLTVLLLLAQSPDGETAATAAGTFAALPEPILKGGLGADLPAPVIQALTIAYGDREDVVERIVLMPRVPIAAIAHLAQHGSEAVTEIVAVNQERLLANPELIELLYMNKRTRMSTADRLIELAVRNDVELSGIPAWKEVAQAIQGELVPEPSAEPLPEDELFWDAERLARELSDPDLEDVYFEDEQGEEKLEDKLIPLYKKLAGLSVSGKIRKAMLGSKEERFMLIREQNKLVACAAARSPLLQEPDVVLLTRSRGVVDDVLRIIGMTPEWMKSYQVKKNLVENAKTPIAIAQRIVPQLREADLRKVAKSKNVSSAVQQAARRHLERRKT
jgi:hypothetical protein